MKRSVVVVIVVLVALAGGFLLFVSNFGKTVVIERGAVVSEKPSPQTTPEPASERLAFNPLTGQMCNEGDLRPYAVMFAADHVAKPLSGIAQADVVVEMPALTNGITRFMGVFSCERPEVIGSIRSARHDFLPFVKSFDAYFAHWGGSYLALDILKTGVIDNIDSIRNPFDTFWRDEAKPSPHNGFTSFARLERAASRLNLRLGETQAKGYVRIKDESQLGIDQNISIGYPKPYNVDFTYDHVTNSYRRWRGGEKEVDQAAGRQVEVKNVVVMTAPSRQINMDYNEVDVEGEGDALVYRNGDVVKGKWKRAHETYGKEEEDDKYYFVDSQGKEIGLVEGKTWISLVQPNQRVELTFK